jgi:site-specific DNA recombinase
MNAIIYARVSTDEQAERGYSLGSQVEACQRYAELNGYEVVEAVQDDCSGMLINRPGLDRVLNMVHLREVDAVIVLASDRWTRNLAHSLELRERLFSAGVELHYANRGKIEDTPEGEMTDEMEAVFNKYWRSKIIEGCRRGKNSKARNGKLVMSGTPPFGYEKIGDRKDAYLVIREREAQIIRQIFHWYVSEMLSIRAIARRLQEYGYPSPNGQKNSAGFWMPSTLHNVLKNELYAGITYYGKTRIINKKRISQPRDKWEVIKAPELAIVDPDTFAAAQVRARRNQELASRNQKREYLFSGFLRCGECGARVIGHATNTRGYDYSRYRCGRHSVNKFKELFCENASKGVNSNILDEKVWGWIDGLMKDEQGLIDGIRKMKEQGEAEAEPKQQRLNMVIGLIEQRKKAAERLVNDLGDEDNTTIRDALKSKLKVLGQEVEGLTIEQDTLQAELSSVMVSSEIEQQVLGIAAAIREEMTDPDDDIKKYILEKLKFEGLYYSGDKERRVKAKVSFMVDYDDICVQSLSLDLSC